MAMMAATDELTCRMGRVRRRSMEKWDWDWDGRKKEQQQG